jgi:hypothetical protein
MSTNRYSYSSVRIDSIRQNYIELINDLFPEPRVRVQDLTIAPSFILEIYQVSGPFNTFIRLHSHPLRTTCISAIEVDMAILIK